LGEVADNDIGVEKLRPHDGLQALFAHFLGVLLGSHPIPGQSPWELACEPTELAYAGIGDSPGSLSGRRLEAGDTA
jgi:hypothetical protein